MSKPSVKILYRDAMIWVVEKPAGFSTYSSSSKDQGWKEFVEEDQNQRLYPIHRLDRDTSGMVVFALDPKSAAVLES